MDVTRTGLALTLGGLALLGAATRARAELSNVLAGRVTGVVAAGDGVAVLREGEAVLLDADGRRVGGCRGERATTGQPLRPDGTALTAEEVLGEAGFSDEDESSEAEDVLDDEGIEPASRRRPVEAISGPPRALALAGTSEAAWIGTADGLWRLDVRDRSCVPVGLGGQELSFVAAQGTMIVAVADATVWRSRDAGASFEVAAVLTSPAHALALAPDGETSLVADDDGVVAVDAARGFRRVLDGRVDALTPCGADVVALAEDGVVRLGAAGDTTVLGPRPPVRALACASADGPRLVAAGVGVWSSADGARWREEPAGLGHSFSSVASAAERMWLASDDGLVTLAPVDAKAPTPLADPEAPAPLANAPTPRLALDRTAPVWAALLPRVAVAFDGWTESTGVAGWRLWVLLTVSVGRRWQRTMTQNPEDLR